MLGVSRSRVNVIIRGRAITVNVFVDISLQNFSNSVCEVRRLRPRRDFREYSLEFANLADPEAASRHLLVEHCAKPQAALESDPTWKS